MKKKIRRDMILKRNNHSQREKSRKDTSIKNKLFCLPEFVKARNILFYVAVKGEAGTGEMIQDAMRKGKNAFLPVTDLKGRDISVSELNEVNGKLKPGPFGIPEPFYPILADPESLDLIIVPGIAFDRRGSRIGYGMGFYDNFLSGLRNKIPTIALAYEFQIVNKIPSHSGDVRVKKIVTEERIIEC